MTILEEVPAELAAVASALHATPVLAGFSVARGTMRVEVALCAPGRLRIRVERPDLLVVGQKSERARTGAPYRADQAAPVPFIDPIRPVELTLEAEGSEAPDRLRVESRLDEAATSHVLTPEVRRRAAALLADGFSAVVLLREGPAVEAEREIEEGLPADGEMICSGIDRVCEVASSLPTIATGGAYQRARARDLGALWWSIPPMFLASMIVEYVLWSFLNAFANFAGILIGVGVALTLGPIVTIAQMRRGRTMNASLGAFLWFALVAPLGLQSGLMFVNCALDSSPVTPWHAQVERLNVTKQENSTQYEAVLQRRQPKQLPVKLSIDVDVYNALLSKPEADRVLILDVRRGVFELNWYTRVELGP